MNIKDIPNILTILRMILIPIICIIFYYNRDFSAFLFVMASITDFFDGYIARKYDAKSDFGSMLDPIADKVLVSSLLILLVSSGEVSVVPVLVILAREFIISGIRDFSSTKNIKVSVSDLAKIKTVTQMLAIFTLMLGNHSIASYSLAELGVVLIWLTTFLTVVTGFSYIKIVLSK